MGDVPRHAQEHLDVATAKLRLLEGTPTVRELKRDALGSIAAEIRRRPWTAVAVAAGLGALLTSSPGTRRTAIEAAKLAMRSYF